MTVKSWEGGSETSGTRPHGGRAVLRRGRYAHQVGNRLPNPYLRLVGLALIMRLPVVVLAPLLGTLRHDYAMTGAAAGLLTTLPIVCFAVFAIPAGTLLRRFGLRNAVTAALVILIGAGALRVAGGIVLLFVGTAVIGCALAVINVAVIVIIAEWFPTPGLPTGVQIAASNVGSAIASAAVVPLALVMGWRASTAVFGVVVLLSLLLWLSGARSPRVRSVGRPVLPRDGSPGWVIVLLIAVMFAGHNLSYYGMTTWLPTVITNGGSTPAGGVAASLFQGLGILGALLVPTLTSKGWSTMTLTIAASTAWLALPTGLLLAPALWPVWVVAGGVAQGGMFAVITMVIVAVPGPVSSLAARSQTIGYAAAAIGPVALGAAHDLSDGWSTPLIVVLSAMGLMLLAGVSAVVVSARRSSTTGDATTPE
jgi:MFS transporter, CP family, cyanate transporter